VLAVGALIPGVATASSLAGDTIQADYIYPTAGNVYNNLGTFTAPGGGHIYVESYSVTGSQITVTADPSGVYWLSASDNGLEFIDLSRNPDISGVTLDAATNAVGVTISDASFTSNSVNLNFENQTWGGNQVAVFDLQFGATPLPSTWTMLVAGFLGLGFLAYRGTKKGAAAIAGV